MENGKCKEIVKTILLEKRIRELEGIESRYNELLDALCLDKYWNSKSINDNVCLINNLNDIFSKIFKFRKKRNGNIKCKMNKIVLNNSQIEKLYRWQNERNIKLFERNKL